MTTDASTTDRRRRRVWTERLAQVVLALLLVAIVYGLSRALAPVLAPVIVSLLIAYFLDPLIDWFEARRVPRAVAIFLVAGAALSVIAAFTVLAVPMLVRELSSAIEAFPAWAERTWDALRSELQTRWEVDLDAQAAELADDAAAQAQQALTTLVGSVASSVATLLNAVLVPVFTFYFLKDFDELKMRPLALVPPRHRPWLIDRARRMDDVVGDWVRGQIQVAITLGVLYAIGLSIIGLKLGAVIGMLAGLLNVVPYLGAAIGIGTSVLMAVIYGGDAVVSQLIGLAVVFAVVQALEGYVITPRLVGEKVGMSPLTVMIVLLLGGSLFGFFGLLLSIPAVAAGSVLLREGLGAWQGSDWFRRDADDAAAGAHPDDATATPIVPVPAVPPEGARPDTDQVAVVVSEVEDGDGEAPIEQVAGDEAAPSTMAGEEVDEPGEDDVSENELEAATEAETEAFDDGDDADDGDEGGHDDDPDHRPR